MQEVGIMLDGEAERRKKRIDQLLAHQLVQINPFHWGAFDRVLLGGAVLLVAANFTMIVWIFFIGR